MMTTVPQTPMVASEGTRSAAGQKLPYAPPTLREFGPVGKLTMNGNGTSPTDGGSGIMNMTSDRRAKRNIIRVGDHPLGVGLYLFSYAPAFHERYGDGRYLGVMADEVEAIRPEAISQVDGYKVVNYAMLPPACPRRH